MSMLRKMSLVGVAVLALSSLSCGSDGPLATNQPDTDYVMFAGVPSGRTVSLGTDRLCSVDLVIPMTVEVVLRAPVNGNIPSTPQTVNDTFLVEKYIVTYRNLFNGGRREGFDVPRAFQQVLPFVPERVPFDLDLEGPSVLLASAKNEPPLNDPANIPAGGLQLEATIQFWGHAVLDPSRQTTGSFKYVFTVFDSGISNAPGCS